MTQGTTDIIISGGILVIVIKELIGLIKGLIPKTHQITEMDMKQAEYQTDMKNLLTATKEVLIELKNEQHETRKEVGEITHIQSNTHKRIGSIDSTLEVFEKVITEETIKESVKKAFTDLKLQLAK